MLLCANWKMNLSAKEATEFINTYARNLPPTIVPTVILAPFTVIPAVAEAVKSSALPRERLAFGGQNVYFESFGAFTGEISATMLLESGCGYAICGHSERRAIFGETDEIVGKKVIRCIETGLTPIFCIGETLDERNAGNVELVLKRQLDVGLSRLSPDQFSKLVVAYEPVWAIGTGVVATPEQAQAAHTFIRHRLEAMCGDAAKAIHILYGGSVNPQNVESLMSRPHIDGALVGGASLKVDSLLALHNGCATAAAAKPKH
ncbi:triose-phosphate isomerase [candidate division KSB1 bacterium]|nr:triose-phosphate isomerase [candidate division KSB1 bacterium]